MGDLLNRLEYGANLGGRFTVLSSDIDGFDNMHGVDALQMENSTIVNLKKNYIHINTYIHIYPVQLQYINITNLAQFGHEFIGNVTYIWTRYA